MKGTLTNAKVAELLALAAEEAEGHVRKAYKRASRLAFIWPNEVAELAEAGVSLTTLPSIGPFLERIILAWLSSPPDLLEPPEPRSHFLTMSEAQRILKRNASWARSYKGDLQMHSTWSDGAGSIAEMAEAAQARGYEYIAITDHSKGLKIAGGIDEHELEQQRCEIDQVNEQLRSFRVLHSVETNLNPQGQADMDGTELRKMELVVGSFHSALRHTTDQTDRYVAALENPHVHILGHPRGRIYNHRIGLRADWSRVFATAAALDKAVEIDCYPDRQDLDVELLKVAKAEGVRIAIDTDAHSPDQLAFIDLGLAAAIEGGIRAERIINFMPADQLLRWIGTLRR